jgi:KDO2-lipid IV(A) lauroyltransferase
MPKIRSRVLDYAVYVAVRLLICLIQALSYEQARGFATALAWLAHKLDRRHRLVAHENLRNAFPGQYTYAQLDTMVRRVYLHFCSLVVEMAHLPRMMHINNWRDRLDMGPDAEVLVKALTSGRPLLCVTGHFGNWEVAGVVMGLLGFHAHAVARELDNPHLEKFLRRFRERTGQRLLSKKGDFDQMQAIMAKGGILATLGDQDAGQRGLFVDFFGRPASTHKVMALLALEYQVPILVVGTPKVAEPMRYRIEIGDFIEPQEYAGRGDAVKAITQRLTTALENIVRKYPEQYFWLHRRWKHQPKPKKGVKAAVA